ncbi:MAG TPA: hypothetical protein VJ598_07795 [Albitalea sp.]|nr:hypothetical protein [Albitalea sp.]
MRRCLALAATVLLAACSSAPLPPDWQLNSRAAMDHAVAATLSGDARTETLEFERARSEIAKTGRIELLAHAELMHCAARVASLALGPCEGFELLRADASAAQRAYADYLAAHVQPQDIALLPPSQRAAAAANEGNALPALQGIDDPLSRLVAASVLFQSGRASPAVLALAVDTASAQGWRRPLLAWLEVQALRAEKAGDVAQAQRVRRRLDVIQGVR